MNIKVTTWTALLVLLIPLYFSSCQNPLKSSGKVLIRIENNSDYVMSGLNVIFPEDEVNYGILNAGSKSRYEEVKKAYRYAYVETVVEGKNLVVQPIDYVGEQPLQNGRYTYVLTVDKESLISGEGQACCTIILELKRD